MTWEDILKEENKRRPMQELSRALLGMFDTDLAYELRQVLNDERFKDLNKEYKPQIDEAIGRIEDAIIELKYTLQDKVAQERGSS